MIRSKARPALIAGLGAVLLPVAVACSSGPAAAEPPPGGHDAFMQCMTEHGVPAPPKGGPDGPGSPGGPGGPGGPPPGGTGGPPPDGPPPAPPGVDQQTWDNAKQACASLAPEPPVRS